MNDGEYAPIHVAAFYNKLEILKWLTSHMADVDLESKGGHTALQLAAINGHMDCLKVRIPPDIHCFHATCLI